MYRKRTKLSQANSTGTRKWGSGYVSVITKATEDVIEDDTQGHFGPLAIYKYVCSGSRISGFENSWDGRNEFDFPSLFWDRTEHLGTKPIPSDLNLATSALAHSNPNQNELSLPNSIYETVSELPALVKQSGQIAIDFLKRKVSPKTLASANIAYQFGISPMVQDVKTLGNLQRSINNRLQIMQGLKRFGRINKKKRLGVYLDAGTWNLYLETNRTFLVTQASYNVMVEAWGISEWILKDPQSNPIFSDQSSRISDFINQSLKLGIDPKNIDMFRAATGLAAYDISDLWNIIPWSWAVDYFANIGQVLDANNNSLGLSPSALAICKKWTTTKSHPQVSSTTGNSFCTEGKMEISVKTRNPVSITSAQQNLRIFDRMLSLNQIGILSSLAILSNRRKNDVTSNPYLNWANNLVRTL